jgi:pentatricopeptide repeat protein
VLKRYLSVYDPTSEKSAGVPALVADRVLESLADASVSLDAKTLSLTMNAYIACNKPYDAIKTFEASVGFSADGSSKKVDVFIGGKEGDSRIIADSKGLNKFTVTDLIRAHAMIGNIKSVRRILAAVEGDEMTIDGVQAMSWHASVEPDTKLYNAVLSIATKSGSQEGLEIATELFDDMCKPVLFKTARPKKNLISYNTMIAAFARADMREKAFAMFREMEEEGVKPDKFTVTSLVKAVVNDDDFDTARNLLRDMKRAGIESDTVGYNYVIQALCKNKLWFEAKELVADMESRGISPDSKTYGLLMSGLLKLNKPGPCLTLFESACADQRTAGLMENVKLYTTAITAAASISDYERALELVSRMTLSGVKPNYKTLTALMGACISAGQLQYAFDVFGKIEKPDGYAKLLLIRAHCDSGDYDSALNILDDKVDCEEKLSGKQIMSSYNYMIRSSLLEKQYDSGKKAMVR